MATGSSQSIYQFITISISSLSNYITCLVLESEFEICDKQIWKIKLGENERNQKREREEGEETRQGPDFMTQVVKTSGFWEFSPPHAWPPYRFGISNRTLLLDSLRFATLKPVTSNLYTFT